jgi:hypothetical protein
LASSSGDIFLGIASVSESACAEICEPSCLGLDFGRGGVGLCLLLAPKVLFCAMVPYWVRCGWNCNCEETYISPDHRKVFTNKVNEANRRIVDGIRLVQTVTGVYEMRRKCALFGWEAFSRNSTLCGQPLMRTTLNTINASRNNA